MQKFIISSVERYSWFCRDHKLHTCGSLRMEGGEVHRIGNSTMYEGIGDRLHLLVVVITWPSYL